MPRLYLSALVISFLFMASASAQPTPYCEGEGCPALYMIEGFEVWMSPVLEDPPDLDCEFVINNERWAAVRYPIICEERVDYYLDTIQAQLHYMGSYPVIPQQAMDALRDSGLTFYFDDPNNMQRWWPCGQLTGCYNGGANAIGGVLGVGPEGNVLRQWTDGMFILHEAAHAYHAQVIINGYDNACIQEVFERNRHRYQDVTEVTSKPELGTWKHRHYGWQNHLEYFATLSEAYFFKFKSYPWNRMELFKHDPEGYYLIRDAWQNPHFCEAGFHENYRQEMNRQEREAREAEERREWEARAGVQPPKPVITDAYADPDFPGSAGIEFDVRVADGDSYIKCLQLWRRQLDTGKTEATLTVHDKSH